MPKRRVVRERALKELYDITKRLSEPEITPVLKGSCRIQGPVDEFDQEVRANTVLSAEENCGSPSKTSHMRPESGTCNVCAAPCSSCMHFNRSMSAMESKVEDDCSDVIYKGKEPLFKSRACDDRQHTTSDASNLVSTCSSHDSLCENAESKVTMRTSETSDGVEDVEMLQKLLPDTVGDQHTTQCNTSSESAITSHASIPSATNQMISNLDKKQQGPEHHDDNLSCVTGVKEANILVSDPNGDSDRKKASSGDDALTSIVLDGLEKSSQDEPASGHMTDSCQGIEQCKNNSKRPSSPSTTGFTSATAVVSECPSSEDAREGSVAQKLQLPLSPPISKPSSLKDSKDPEENLDSQLANPGECVVEHIESSSAGQVTVTMDDGIKEPATHNSSANPSKSEDDKMTVVKSSSATGALVKIHPLSETEIEVNGKDAHAEYTKKSDLTKAVENPSASLQASDIQEKQKSPICNGENSGSDILEDDVKVCDICGDAGREDFLAICSRCSDGAEHTYCMRIMLDKVPDGDWLCEECQLKEEAEKEKQNEDAEKEKQNEDAEKQKQNENAEKQKQNMDAEKEKQNKDAEKEKQNKDAEKEKQNKDAEEEEVSAVPKAPPSSERNQNLNTKPLLRLHTKAEEEEEEEQQQITRIISSPRASTKRPPESLEVAPQSKKLAVEASSGTPRMSTPVKSSVLSRESSFKRMDLGKAKPVNPLHSSGSPPVNNSPDADYTHPASGSVPSKPQQQIRSPRGSLSRSATFSSVKHKVKQLPEDFSQNLKLSSSGIRKDGLKRAVEKSTSFKSTGLSHSISSDSKVKPQSDNFSRAAVVPRVWKQMKDRIEERRNPSRADIFSSSSLSSSNMSHPKSDLKAPLYGDTLPSHSLNNNTFDLKASQNNGKHNALPKTPNFIAQDGFEATKHAPLSRGPGVSSNGICISEEQKSCQFGPKEDATAGPLAANKISGIPDTHVNDTLVNNQDGKMKDSTLIRTKHTVSSGSKNIRCHRCNEMGHDMHDCKEVSLQFPALKDPAVRNLRDTANKSIKWKEVTAAVMPKTLKNNRLGNQPDELPTSNAVINCEVESKDHLQSSSAFAANLHPSGGTFLGKDAWRETLTDFSRTSTGFNYQQQHVEEAVSAPREASLNIFPNITDETKLKPPFVSSPFQASVLGKPLRISAIPEHDYRWQGSFEVQRSGALTEVYDGIQAHLSTCASPRVLEVVNKFPSRIQLVEAPRQTTWPAQFQGNNTTEDNIALYFFARDVPSYERNYKKLLENMLENDLALKGNLDGIELLIFPSNHLHEKSQRWNRLFYLWAVFRERRLGCPESVADSHKQLCGTILDAESRKKDLPTSVSDSELPKNERSPTAKAANPSFGVSPSLPSSGQVVGNSFTKEESLEHRCLSSQEDAVDKHSQEGHPSCSSCETQSLASAGEQDYHLGNHSLLRLTKNNAQLHSEANYCASSLKETYRDSGGGSIKELQATTLPIDLNEGSEGDESNMKFKGWSTEVLEKNSPSEGEIYVEMITKNQQGSHSSGRKRLHHSSIETASEVSGKMFNAPNHTAIWEKAECTEIGRESESKKMRLDNDVHVGSNAQGQMLGDGFPSMTRNADPVFLKKGDYSYDCAIPLFPVDTDPISNCKSQWQTLKSDIQDLPGPDVPDLELALGAEKKPPKQGSFPWLPRSVDEKNSQNKFPSIDDGSDDVSSSLSLSLAFPFSRKEQSAKPSPKPEQLLLEKSHVSTSLLLFGRNFPDP